MLTVHPYESLDELNYLASLVEELGDTTKFEAALQYGEHSSSVQELINFTQNLDCYEFYPDIEDEEALGYYFAAELNAIDIPEEYRVCAFPKERSILETLKAFRENPPREFGGKAAPALDFGER